MTRHSCTLLALAALALAAPLGAGAPKESNCSWILKTEDGKFRYQPQYGWSLMHAAHSPDGLNFPANLSAVTCLRSPPVLVESDLAVLKRGITISLGTQDQGITIIAYTLSEGTITWRVTSGGLSDKNRKTVEKAVAQLQGKV